jgi:hypothetical protein
VSDLLAKSAVYLDGYDRQLSAVIADEQYEQELPTGAAEKTHASLQSDIMLLGLGGSSWVEFRDVFEADFRKVRDHTARLQALLQHPAPDLMAQAQRIADESARYNLGAPRNINVPTMALTYLSRANQARSVFAVIGQDTIGKTRVTILRFTETATPPLIKVPAGHLETTGRFWIADDTGAVWRSELRVNLPESAEVSKAKSLRGTITVNYAFNPDLKLVVPASMEEYYEPPVALRGRATYSRYQAFSVNVSTLRGGGGI